MQAIVEGRCQKCSKKVVELEIKNKKYGPIVQCDPDFVVVGLIKPGDYIATRDGKFRHWNGKAKHWKFTGGWRMHRCR